MNKKILLSLLLTTTIVSCGQEPTEKPTEQPTSEQPTTVEPTSEAPTSEENFYR